MEPIALDRITAKWPDVVNVPLYLDRLHLHGYWEMVKTFSRSAGSGIKR